MASASRISSIVVLTLSEDEAADLRGILAGLRFSNDDQPSLVSIYDSLTYDMWDSPLPFRFAEGLLGKRVNLSGLEF